MKTIIFTLMLLFVTNCKSMSQISHDIGRAEILIRNYSAVQGGTVTVKVFPVGAVFSGWFASQSLNNKYSLKRSNQGLPPHWPIGPGGERYIVGGTKTLLSNEFGYVDFDDQEYYHNNSDPYQNTRVIGGISFGLWKFEFYDFYTEDLIEECYIDYRDFNLGVEGAYSSSPDIILDIIRKPNSSRDSLEFCFINAYDSPHINIQDSRIINKTIKLWERIGTNDPTIHEGFPNKGLFKSVSLYSNYPIDATQFGGFKHLNPGIIDMNIEIENDSYISNLIDTPTVIKINTDVYLKLKKNKILDITESSSSDPLGYFEMNVETNGKLLLDSGSMIMIRNRNHLNLNWNSRLYLGNKAQIIIKQGAVFCNYGALTRGNGHIIYEGGSIHHIMCASLADYVMSDSAKIILDSNAVLEIPDSTTISFFGNSTGLIMHPNSVIKFGVNSKLLFDSSATLIAKGATFTSLDSSKKWEGIVLQNSGADSILDCTFSNAKTSLSFVNTPGKTFISRVVKGNVFNVPSGSDNIGIYGENNFRITIQDNIFNLPSNPTIKIVGVFLKNSNTSGVESLPEENEPAPAYRMFLLNNTFNNGSASIMLLNYTSSYIPFYVKGNVCNSASDVGIIGRNLTGTFKDNIISGSGAIVPMGIHLIASSPDLYNNTIVSENVSLHTIGSSYPNLSPLVSGSNLSWTGGKNRFTSIESDNIQLANIGSAYTNLGENRFSVDTLNGSYHIYGLIDSTVQNYEANNNCWFPGGNPRIHLRWNETTVPVEIRTGLTSIDCDREIDPNGFVVDYIGNGVYDSLKQSSDTAGSNLTTEQQLYIQGQNYLNAGLFTEGISTLKNLTDTYNYFEDLPASVYELYSCYENLDTNSDQNYRNTLYGNLKIYLDDKINNGDYDAEFLSNAYNITVMCDANMQNYNDAANGFEFIALFHPDPDIRLNASWDYAEIEALMGGGNGGGERQLQVSSDKLREVQLKITNYELRIEKLNELKEIQEINEIKRMNEIISNDPIMNKMKESYEKISKERALGIEETDNQLNEISKTINKSNYIGKENSIKSEQFQKQSESYKFKNEKAKRNIFELSNLSKPELEKRRIEDMFLSAKDARNTISEKNQNLINPLDFKLYQNYPNPFNPSTTISFSLSENTFVKLKVYDITGKEVKTLVNEFKQSGSYSVRFDGSSFSSGMYYYRLETQNKNTVKNFEVKKLILIK